MAANDQRLVLFNVRVDSWLDLWVDLLIDLRWKYARRRRRRQTTSEPMIDCFDPCFRIYYPFTIQQRQHYQLNTIWATWTTIDIGSFDISYVLSSTCPHTCICSSVLFPWHRYSALYSPRIIPWCSPGTSAVPVETSYNQGSLTN